MSSTVTLIGSVLGGVVLFGAAVRAWPAVWSFVKAAAKAPVVLEQILHEFAPNSGNSMRDKINDLAVDAAHLRETTHRIDGKLSATVSAQAELIAKVEQHTVDDGASFADTHEAQTQILERLEKIERCVDRRNQ